MRIKTLAAGAGLLLAAANGSYAEDSINWQPEDVAALEETVGAGTYGTVTSILVMSDGATLYEGYFNGADAATLHDTRSVTKTVAGMAVGAAVQEGLLSADTHPADFFADLAPFANPDPRKLEVTLADLLTMSGPLECNDWNQFSRGNEERMYLVEDWSRFFWDLPVRGFPSWETPPEHSPYGRAFSYCTSGVQILGEVVERAAGEPFTDYVERMILTPLGISGHEWPRNGRGQAHMGGGLRLTARHLARLGELQRAAGTHNGQQIYSAEWAAVSATPQAAIPGQQGTLYGYLWWLMPYEVAGETHHAVSMSGNGGNRVMVLPEFDLTVVFTNTDYNSRGMHQRAQAFFEHEIVARLAP